MNKKELMDEFASGFNKMKNELGFKSSLEELEYAFFFKDAILQSGFVSDGLSRQLAARIRDTYMSWANYLHSIIFPSPGNMLSGTEAKPFNDGDKKEIWNLMNKAMEIVSRNSWIGLSKDKKEEARYFDDSVDFWKKEFEPKLKEILEKINKAWK